MAKSGKIDADINKLLWMVGWNAKKSFGVILILSIASFYTDIPGWIGGLGFLAAFIIPPVGYMHVRRNWKQVRDAGLRRTRDAASDIIKLQGDNVNQYSLWNYSSYSPPLPPKVYQTTSLLVEDSLLVAHTDASINLPKLEWEVGNTTNEYYYDQVTNINYEPADDDDKMGEFWINLSGGHGDNYKSSREPDSALNDIQQRLRQYKRSD